MFIGTGQEIDILAVMALKARQRIGGDQLIGMADMRLAIGIGNRSRYVEAVLVAHYQDHSSVRCLCPLKTLCPQWLVFICRLAIAYPGI